MTRTKFLRLFALIELLTAVIFITLAVMFYISRQALGGDIMIPAVFGFIGLCALIAAPVMIAIAKKKDKEDTHN